jgi:hypothetical protein
VLCCGPRAVAGGVTSFAVRRGGAGGPALLYTTRQSLLYAVMLRQLGSYVHREAGTLLNFVAFFSLVFDWLRLALVLT